MKETAKRREKAKESKAEKQKESQQGPEAQDVEMPEEESSAAAKPAKEQDSITLEGYNNLRVLHLHYIRITQYRLEKITFYYHSDFHKQYVSLARVSLAWLASGLECLALHASRENIPLSYSVRLLWIIIISSSIFTTSIFVFGHFV